MRKTVVRIGILCLLALCVCVSALAADIGGVSQLKDGVMATKANNGKGVNIDYQNANPEAQYVVYCTTEELNLTGGKVPTANNVAYYRHEVGRGMFNVFPNVLTEGQTYYVYLSASGDDDIRGLTLVATFQYGASYSSGLRSAGEVDDNDGISVSDALAICNWIVGNRQLTPEQLAAADVDGAEGVSVSDALAICNWIVGNRASLG